MTGELKKIFGVNTSPGNLISDYYQIIYKLGGDSDNAHQRERATCLLNNLFLPLTELHISDRPEQNSAT